MRSIPLVVTLLIVAVSCLANQTQKYDKEFEVKGKLILKQFYGPPGFGATPKVDQTEKQFVLQVSNPIDFIGQSDPSSPAENNVSEMQLTIGETLLNKTQRLVGKSVIATVIAFHSISRLQHTKVLLEVKSLKPN